MLLGCSQSPKGSKNIPDQFQWSPIGDARWRMTVIDGCNVHESISGTNTTSATNVYDEQSRLHLVSYSKDYALTSSAANLTTSYQYDYTDTGNLEKLTMTSGNASYTYTPSYDALDRVYSSAAVMTTTSGSLTNTVTYDFTVGSNSNESLQVSQYTSQFGSNNVSYNYTYDANGNITKITLSTGAEYRYVYDDIGQLIREDNSTLNRTYVYSYDDAGNILSKKTYALAAAGVTPAPLYSTYSYGYTDSWGDLLTSYRGVSFTYDEIGNPLTYYNGSSYTFTWENGRRLKTATVGSNTLSFTYNHDGIRTSKTVNGVVHNYTVSGSLILTEEWGTNLVVYLYDANGAPVGMRYRTSSMAEGVFYTFWFDKNLQGDVVAVYNETGAKVLSYTYDAWGNKTTTVHSSSGSNGYAQYNAITYRGYYYDAETGFYYLQSRYYDPQIGRFINADSVIVGTSGELHGYNMFAYAFNNPIAYVDYNGNWPKLSDVLVAAAAVALVVAAVAASVVICAAVAPAAVAVGSVAVSTAAITTAATTVATQAATVAVCASAASLAAKKAEKKRTQTYSVYFLEDDSGTIRYVGRVTDSGYRDRMRYHASTRGLTPAYRVSGLTYAEARGLEEIGMIECHTLNAANPLNNQIHGIGPQNNNGEKYLNAACDYLLNRAENSLLNILG